jgi:hypothetical protein
MYSKSLLETYLSDVPLLNKKLGVQVEVVLGSPQAHALVETCLWIAENKQQLRREKHESSLHFPQSIRRPSSDSST